MAEISEKKLISMLDRQAKSLCCNRSTDGYCCTKDMMCAWRKSNEEFSNRGITCRWFREAVLPADKELERVYEQWKQEEMGKREAEYRGVAVPTKTVIESDIILCHYCKKPILKKVNNQKYCEDCRNAADKKTRAARRRFERNQQTSNVPIQD